MVLIPPPLPSRSRSLTINRTTVLNEHQSVFQKPPRIEIAPVRAQSMKIVLHDQHVFNVYEGKLSAVDLVTGEVQVLYNSGCSDIRRKADQVILVLNDKSEQVVAYDEQCNEAGPIVSKDFVVHNQIKYMLSSVHEVASWIHARGYLWTSWSSGKISIYDLSNGDCIEKLLEWNEGAKVEHFDFSPQANQIVAVFADSMQLALYDATLTEYHKHLENMKSRQTIERRVHVASWNVDSSKPPVSMTFWEEWLGLKDSPDIIFIGLQEIIDLDSTTEHLKSNSERIWQWTDAMIFTDYCLASEPVVMVGLVLIVLVRSGLKVKHQSVSTVKTGLKGRHGNKGGVAWRGFLDDTSLCVINCHLTAGQDATSQRNTDAAVIMKTIRFPKMYGKLTGNGGTGEQAEDHDILVFFGDLNYRLDCSRDTVIDSVRSRDFSSLVVHDQLRSQASSIISGLGEGPISFPPTYKYDPGTALFDTSEKQRIPSYCDRILFRPSARLRLSAYNHYQDIHSSDHRPIYARFCMDSLQPVQNSRY